MSCIIEFYLNVYSLPSLPTAKWMYQCDGSVNIVEENINLVTDYSTINIYDILLQLSSTLLILSQNAFTYGTPTINSLYFENKACKFSYDSINTTFQTTLRFTPSFNSAINIGYKRFYFNQPQLSSKYFEVDKCPKISIKQILSTDINALYSCTYNNIKIPCLPKYNKIYKTCYKIGEDYQTFYSYVTNYGLPLFYSSFDIYSFLVSILINPILFNSFMSNLKLELLWKNLWNPDQYDSLMYNLKLLNPLSTAIDILQFLSNYDLRCDAIKYFWETLKTTL